MSFSCCCCYITAAGVTLLLLLLLHYCCCCYITAVIVTLLLLLLHYCHCCYITAASILLTLWLGSTINITAHGTSPQAFNQSQQNAKGVNVDCFSCTLIGHTSVYLCLRSLQLVPYSFPYSNSHDRAVYSIALSLLIEFPLITHTISAPSFFSIPVMGALEVRLDFSQS